MVSVARAVVGVLLVAVLLGGCGPEPYVGPEGAPKVAVIGDSLLSGAETEIDAAFPDAQVATADAPGHTLSMVQDTIEHYVSTTPDVQVLVIGTNDWSQEPEVWAAAVKAALDSMASVPVVLWVNHSEDIQLLDLWPAEKYEHHLRYNLALFRHERSGAYPNFHVLDWATALVEGDAAEDGIHLTQQGQDHLAALVREGYERWYTPPPPPPDEA
jgi:hypothetical protein